MNGELVSLKTFPYRHEAENAQQILETAGIPSMLSGDDASGWAPHVGLASGGIKLLVNREDLEQAVGLLEEPPEVE
jgi:hypothetical protein